MSNRPLLAWALILLLALMPFCAAAETLDSVWTGAAGGANAQAWLDGALT